MKRHYGGRNILRVLRMDSKERDVIRAPWMDPTERKEASLVRERRKRDSMGEKRINTNEELQ